MRLLQCSIHEIEHPFVAGKGFGARMFPEQIEKVTVHVGYELDHSGTRGVHLGLGTRGM